jgi:CheY-like chemotaxis protein
VLINLCGNAVKFSRNGHVKIKVSLDKNHIVFEVIDNGIGIEEDLLAGLFNPFYQADPSTARKFGGTGLGLAISKQLCQLLEGELTAVSEKGKGSTFTFRLPYKKGTAPEEPAKADLSILAGKRVLLAEDNTVNLLLATRILEKNGLLVDSAENGKIALNKASINDYDFILMDMQMPELSGTEATEQIRNIGFMQPIIAMTANTTDSDKEACFNSGMNDYLSKPIEQQQLLKTLELWSTVV